MQHPTRREMDSDPSISLLPSQKNDGGRFSIFLTLSSRVESSGIVSFYRLEAAIPRRNEARLFQRFPLREPASIEM